MTEAAIGCRGCTLCCRLFLINLNEEEYRSGKYFTELLTDGGIPDDFVFAEENGLNIVKKKKNGSCVYLRNNRCSIYDSRPEVCRDFLCSSPDIRFIEMIEELNEKR